MNKLLLLFTILFIFSCEEVVVDDPIVRDFESNRDVFVLNEGNFGATNASITYKNLAEDTLEQNVFMNINDQNIGDVCQSYALIDDELWVIMNGTAEVVIMDRENLEIKERISLGNTSPVNIIQVGGLVYITSFTDYVATVNIDTREVEYPIETVGYTEDCEYSNGYLYISNPGDFATPNNMILKVDETTYEVVDFIEFDAAPQQMLLDGNQLYVMCQDFDDGGIAIIDVETFTISNFLSFNQEVQNAYIMRIEKMGEEIYFQSDRLYRLDGSTLSESNLFFEDFTTMNGFSVNHERNELYVLDAVDYVSRGVMKTVDTNGNVLATDTVGITPRHVVIY